METKRIKEEGGAEDEGRGGEKDEGGDQRRKDVEVYSGGAERKEVDKVDTQ